MKDYTFTEGDLKIEIKGVVDARRFDDRNRHGLSHCMKAVDFIVERSDCYQFLEFKDPEDPRAGKEDRENFVCRFRSGQIDEDLTRKFRDSFLYEWAACRADDKPVHFLVLIALTGLQKAELDRRTTELKQKLPLRGPKSDPWPRPFASSCAVFNLAAWNSAFPDLAVSRESGG